MPAGAYWLPHADHHIIHRSIRRSDESWNILRCCHRCHESHHSRVAGWPELTLAHMLFVKRESGDWKPKLLRELYCKALPKTAKLPPEYIRERAKYRPFELPEMVG